MSISPQFKAKYVTKGCQGFYISCATSYAAKDYGFLLLSQKFQAQDMSEESPPLVGQPSSAPTDQPKSEFLGSSKQRSTADLPAPPAALRVGTLRTALCTCCKLCARGHPPDEWRVSICAAPRRVTPLKICGGVAQLRGPPLLVPALADPVQGTS